MFSPAQLPASIDACMPIRQCPAPPATPDGPCMRQSPDVEKGPNDFTLGIDGPDPMLETGGSHDDQERQRDFVLALNSRAALSYATSNTGVRMPGDGEVEQLLGGLERNPPIGEDGREVTHAVYQSTIPNATADQAFEHFVNNPNEVFNAGGMEIRPPTARLEDGGRYMLEVGGPPPAWLPIEITVDAANNAFTIHTLDGHVLRGEQTFTFTDNCEGGVTLTQDARFQAGTQLVGDLQNLAPISEGQHESWQFAHREIYEQFNGDRDYAGLGTDLDLGKWLDFGLNLLRDPGRTVNVGIDVAGEIANETFDSVGAWADQGIDAIGTGVGGWMDRLGIPGGDLVEHAIDGTGDFVEDGLDLVGDTVSRAADTAGDVAETVIDALNPFD